MRISKKCLKVLIENYLKESGGGDDDWLGPEPENYGRKLDTIEKPDYSEEYTKYLKILETQKKLIQDEITNDKSDQIPEESRNSLKKMIGKIKLVLVKKIGNKDPGTFATAFSILHTHKNVYEPSIDDISDDDIIAGKENFDAYKKSKFKNPVVLIVPKIFSKKVKEISDEQEARIIAHEVDHVKYAILQTHFKTLNQDQIRNVLRKDLKDSDRNKIADILASEGKYYENYDAAYKNIEPMYRYYLAIFSEENVKEKANIEEIAARIKTLNRLANKDEIIQNFKSGKLNFESAENIDIHVAQLLPFLKKDFKQEEIDKVAINTKIKTKKTNYV